MKPSSVQLVVLQEVCQEAGGHLWWQDMQQWLGKGTVVLVNSATHCPKAKVVNPICGQFAWLYKKHNGFPMAGSLTTRKPKKHEF